MVLSNKSNASSVYPIVGKWCSTTYIPGVYQRISLQVPFNSKRNGFPWGAIMRGAPVPHISQSGKAIKNFAFSAFRKHFMLSPAYLGYVFTLLLIRFYFTDLKINISCRLTSQTNFGCSQTCYNGWGMSQLKFNKINCCPLWRFPSNLGYYSPQ